MSTYLVTGANRGIGLEYCRQLKQRGDNVIAVCRSVSNELKDLGVQIETDIDITAESSVAQLVKRLDGKQIDVLINNAGIIEQVSRQLPTLLYE